MAAEAGSLSRVPVAARCYLIQFQISLALKEALPLPLPNLLVIPEMWVEAYC